MADPTPSELADMRAKAKLASSMPEIETEIAGMRRTLLGKVFSDIRASTLTPEKAMTYWMEMFSYDRLETRLRDSAAQANDLVERS